MINNYIENYKYSTIKLLEDYLTEQIIEDHRNSLVEFEKDILTDDVEINKEEFDKSNQLLYIKNYTIFIDIFTSIRSSSPIMTYFYKDLDFINVFSKLSNTFPFLLLRIKENRSCMCKNIDSLYDFPIKDIFKKDITTKKKYDIILESVGYLKYRIISYMNRVINKEYEFKISEAHQKTMLNDIMGISSDIPFQTYLMNMYVCVVKQEQYKENILIIENVDLMSKVSLNITRTSMSFEIEKNTKKEVINISPTQNPIILADDFVGGKYNIEIFQQLYRLPYPKLINVKSKLYYCLAHSGDDYYFMKVIATTDHIDKGRTFGDVFGSFNIIIEGYKVKPIQK